MKKQSKAETRETVERLQCKLTEPEVLAYARKMVGIRASREENENQLDALKKEFNARIATLEAQESELALKVGTGKEWREVVCVVTRDFEAGEVYSVRQDTFDEVSRRTMTAEERQANLPLDGQ